MTSTTCGKDHVSQLRETSCPLTGVLIVKGVLEDGHRELLAVDVADTENEGTYDQLFRGLKERGLHGV